MADDVLLQKLASIDRLLASALHIEYDSVLHHLVRKSVEIAIDKDSDGSKATIDARQFLE